MDIRNNLCAAFAIVIGASAYEAHAQYSPDATMDLGMGMGQIALSQSTLSGTRAIGSASQNVFVNATRAAPPRGMPTRVDPARAAVRGAVGNALVQPAPATDIGSAAALDFHRNPVISTRVQQEMLDVGAQGNPQVRAELAPAFTSGKVLQEFDRLLGKYGHSPQNLADVAAAYLVVAWEVVNDRDSGDSPAGQLAVRRQLARAFLADPTVRAMSDDQKQEIAERLSYTTMIAGAAYQSFKRNGDRGQLTSLQNGVYRNVLTTGVDLRRMDLTDGGLVVR